MGDVLELDTVEEFEDGRDGGDREVAVVEAMDDGMSDLKDKGEKSSILSNETGWMKYVIVAVGIQYVRP